ncbi:MAG: hypothetical protein ACEPOW_10075 [Bacteroidales bacterium]
MKKKIIITLITSLLITSFLVIIDNDPIGNDLKSYLYLGRDFAFFWAFISAIIGLFWLIISLIIRGVKELAN